MLASIGPCGAGYQPAWRDACGATLGFSGIKTGTCRRLPCDVGAYARRSGAASTRACETSCLALSTARPRLPGRGRFLRSRETPADRCGLALWPLPFSFCSVPGLQSTAFSPPSAARIRSRTVNTLTGFQRRCSVLLMLCLPARGGFRIARATHGSIGSPLRKLQKPSDTILRILV